TQHLSEQVAPVVADWLDQLFIKKALHMRSLPNLQSLFPQQIKSFLPILGPLHMSLNNLAKKPRPWRINLLLELARN
ncbi:12828_t:CDS:2, partial [Racocetra fulgida]